jgi:hypothetical protein
VASWYFWRSLGYVPQSGEGDRVLLDRYAAVAGEADEGQPVWRQLRALNQSGVTRRTLILI